MLVLLSITIARVPRVGFAVFLVGVFFLLRMLFRMAGDGVLTCVEGHRERKHSMASLGPEFRNKRHSSIAYE